MVNPAPTPHPVTAMPPRAGRTSRLVRAVLLAVCVAPPEAAAQQDSATVVAGAEYAAGPLRRWLLGDGYREMWTRPIRVPVLDLERFAGGLTPVRRGGSLQTIALRFRGADGREYNFRSVNKELTPALPSFARRTLLDRLYQDVTSAQLPVAPIVASALLDAVGVLNPGPGLVILPDHPVLGEFREQYAGMLGTLEVHANEGEDDEPLFANAPEVASTEDMLEAVQASHDHRVDAHAFLAARLMDLFLNDFDRHAGQWRWARFDHEGTHWWTPVPEDRDYAFVDYEGVLVGLARQVAAPRLVSFDEHYPDLLAMMDNSLALNRRLLAGLPREAWDSVSSALRVRLTDEVIRDAVALLPPEYGDAPRAELARVLRARRDALSATAAAFYRLMAENVEIHATDEAERVDVVRADDGSVRVTVVADDASPAEPAVYARAFRPGETNEIRLFLHGGDDRATVTGGAGKAGRMVVRVLGGQGNDRLEDRGRGSTILYDAEGENELSGGSDTRLDRRPYSPPAAESGVIPRLKRDWGTTQAYAPWVGWLPDAELVVGGEVAWTRRAFRHHPFAERHRVRGQFAPLHGRFGAEYRGAVRRENRDHWLELVAGAANLHSLRFHGFGNQTPPVDPELARVWMRRLRLEALVHFPAGEGADLTLGPVLRYTDLETEGTRAGMEAPLGVEPFGQAGGTAGLRVDTRDDPWFPRRGGRLRLQASAFAPLWSAKEAFGRLEAVGSAYLSLPLPLRPVLALRAGGAEVLGAYPLHEAAVLGGSGSFRGERFSRFAGDASLFGNAELRVPVTPAKLVVRGDLGFSLLADAGRVFVDGSSPGGWHTATGGGLWFATPAASLSLTLVDGGAERRAYLHLGMPF